jgi:uncharacterized protein YjbI with pentapeptide repeats
MHSHDPDKDAAAFQQEIEAILRGSSQHNPEGKLDFTRFVFPVADFSKSEFRLPAYFEDATFCRADFRKATFARAAHFFMATFTRFTTFAGARFTQEADFHHATFTRGAEFSWARFARAADFWGVTFSSLADFPHVTFAQDADFHDANFGAVAYFTGAIFTNAAYFSSTSFSQEADFYGATFVEVADFRGAAFNGIADFRRARLQEPRRVMFQEVNKKARVGLRARFVKCRIEAVDFTDVRWRHYEGRIALQDEWDVRFDPQMHQESRLVAVAYRQLRTNFDRTWEYGLAEDCLIAAWEMERMDTRSFLIGTWGTARKFYESHPRARRVAAAFTVLSLYKLLSKYGSSYARALGVLGLMFVFLVLSFPLVGLRKADDSIPLTANAPLVCPDEAPISWCQAWTHDDRAPELWRTFKSGMLVVAEVAKFQGKPTLEPATTWGRGLAILELILIPGQLALLLLALRRRFRR